MRAQAPFAVAPMQVGTAVLMRPPSPCSVVARETGPENACPDRLPGTASDSDTAQGAQSSCARLTAR